MAASRGKNQTFDVFVGNLPNDANEKNVGKIFTPYGEIGGITVRESNKAKGPNKFYAFVKFLCEPDAEKACSELDKMNLNGAVVTVKKADRDRRGPYDGKKIPKSPDSESSDAVGGSVHSSDSVSLAEMNSVGKALELLRVNARETVMITHVENPITLWLQVVNDENTKKIFNITEQLATLCPAASPVTSLPEPGKTYASLYTEDNMWYRCKIKQTLGTDKYKIQYIDYGNTEEVSLSSLVEIPATVGNLKGMALKLVLHNVRAKDLTDKQAMQLLRTVTDNQMASLEKKRSLADGSGFYGELYINDQSVGDAMINAGYCQTRPGLGKTSGPNRQMDGMMDNPGPQMMDMSDKNFQQREFNAASSATSAAFQQMTSGPQDATREKELQSELLRKRRELEKMRNDKDQTSIQLEYMKTKVKTLQEEFAVSAAKLQEDTVSKRIDVLVTLSKVVRHLRDQFPTDDKPCLLEEAIDVCTSKDRVDNSKCTTLQPVGSALAKYKAAQDEISKCKQPSEMDDIVKSRDETRKELHDSLKSCLEELSFLPLEERSKLVQDLQMRITTLYGEYLKLQIHDCPSIENVSAGFKTWKMKKDTEFTDVRTVTNIADRAVQTALSQVRDRIGLECGKSSDRPEIDTDVLMKTYAHSLQREINVTDLIRTKDANLVANVINSVIRELQAESAMLENFQVLKGEFKSRQESLAPWLEEKPTFSEMQENRKLLRSLRSKLRHKLADKLDLEESGSEGELDSIKGEEEKIRSELQAALVKSDSLIHEVAALADSNFPELIIQYPDLAIDQVLIYKGLVKSNRELDHYSIRPGFRPGTHLSTFNGQSVLIQEFLLDQTTKDEFIERVINYPGETCEIQAIFFSKNERQVYVECAWVEDADPIEMSIKESMPTPHVLQQICIQLTQEVANLHKHGCIHGEINTHSIVLKYNAHVILMSPDFCKTVQDRLNKKVTTENGLVFQCPDIQYTTADMIGAAADIYNLVLFMFWLHCPSPQQSSFSNGSTDTQVQNMDKSLKALFDAVLGGKTAGRLTAEQILKIDYFKKILPDSFDPPPVLQSAILTPSSPTTPPPQAPVIKSMDEPMEIGVFKADDFPNPIREDLQQPSAVDTDDSWTTKSSSSGSRVESPLENGVNTVKEEVTETASDVNTADEINLKTETNETGVTGTESAVDNVDGVHVEVIQNAVKEEKCSESDTPPIWGVVPNIPNGDASHQMGDVGHQMNAGGDSVTDAVGDVFSQASNSDYLREDRKSLGQILSQSTPTTVPHGLETNVEEETLKSLLKSSKTFLTSSHTDLFRCSSHDATE